MSLIARLFGKEQEALDRRQFFREARQDALAGLGLYLGLKTVGKILEPKVAEASSVDELTDAQIQEYMAKPRVEDILGSSVRYITPQSWDREVNASDKPVLVLVYDNNLWKDACKRSAIIFKELSKKYSNSVNFYACPGDNTVTKYNIQGPPSIAMYSRYDLVKGETPQRNDGRMKQIDIMRGGPDEMGQQYLPKIISGPINNWIKSNLVDLSNIAYRFGNSYLPLKPFSIK